MKSHNESIDEGCGVLFKSGSGIIICGEDRSDGCTFYCKRCLKEKSEALVRNSKEDDYDE